jgi:hypothetical protein
MGLVAATVGTLTLGAYVGRHLGGGASILSFVLGFICIFALSFARDRAGQPSAYSFCPAYSSAPGWPERSTRTPPPTRAWSGRR